MKCSDCPELQKDGMPADWRPRWSCCIVESRKREVAEARAREAAARVANDRPNRAARRAAKAKARRP
jgi:hypothetical protein